VRARPTGLDQPNGGGAYDRGSNVARPGADAGEQEPLLAERRELENSLTEKRGDLTWLGKATGRDSVNAMISMCTDFLVGTMSADIAGQGGHAASKTFHRSRFFEFDVSGIEEVGLWRA
jgi:hypothetical protein